MTNDFFGNVTAPHQSLSATASPPPMGSHKVAEHFCLHKILLAKFYAGKGKPWNKADNFCLIVRKHDEARGSLKMLPKK